MKGLRDGYPEILYKFKMKKKWEFWQKFGFLEMDVLK